MNSHALMQEDFDLLAIETDKRQIAFTRHSNRYDIQVPVRY
jgi:hypothetical protein